MRAAILSNAQAAQNFLARDPIDPDEVRDIIAGIVADDRRASEAISRLRVLLKKGCNPSTQDSKKTHAAPFQSGQGFGE